MKNVEKAVVIMLVSGGLLSSRVFAQGSVFAQAGFEGISGSVSSPGLVSLATNTGTIGSWSCSASGTAGLPSSVTIGTISGGPTPGDGTNIARLSIPLGLGDSVSLSQSSMTPFMPNTAYDLSFEMDQGTTAGLVGNASVQLLAGTTPVATLTSANLASLLDTAVGFQTINLYYNTGATAPSGNIGVNFTAGSLLGVFGNLYLDNINLTLAPVPEPSSAALIGACCSLLALHRWRRLAGRRSLKPDSLDAGSNRRSADTLPRATQISMMCVIDR